VDSSHYSESELCRSAVTVSFSKFLLGKRCTSHNAPPTSRERKRNNKVSPLIFQTALMLHHPKNGSFKTTVTEILTTVRGMKIAPLLRYPTTTTWHNSHCRQSTNFSNGPRIMSVHCRETVIMRGSRHSMWT